MTQPNVFDPHPSTLSQSINSPFHQMKKLYSAQVARPLAATNTRPTRLGFATTAWCRYEDLIATISGCGAVAVFHADAPGEATLLVGVKRAPARHVIWRNAPEKPAMLVVADAAGRITFWLARDRRVNVWSAVAKVDLTAVAVAVGWNKSCTAIAAVLAHGGLLVYAVRDEPFDTTRRRAYQKSRDTSRRHLAHPKWSPNAVELISCNQKLPDMFGGQLRCAAVAPGHVDPTSVALVTVSAAQPHRLNVWHVTIAKAGNAVFEVKPVSAAEMNADEDGSCVACSVIPKRGMLVAVGDRGVIARWSLKNHHTARESGWDLPMKTRIYQATEDAAARGVVPQIDDNQNAMVNAITRGLQLCKKRKVYAFEVTPDSKRIVTSTSVGLFVWDVEKLNIVGGYTLKRVDGTEGSPYWGLCISPGAAAVMALNGQGGVDAFSLVSPLTRGSAETVSNAATNVARRLVATTYTDGLRGGWDLIAVVAMEGSVAASLVAKSLTLNNMRNVQNPPVSSEKLANLKSLMMRIVNVQDSTAHAAKRLLEVAIDAIRQSAPDYVKLKLMVTVKEAKQLTLVENIQKLIQQGLSTTRVNMHQLAAAPLADWTMVLSAVWLQRCAVVVAKHDSKPQLGTVWAGLVSLASSNNPTEQEDGMVRDPMLIHALRSAALAAVVLVALEDEHGEPEADPRYYRFPREQSAQIIAALWEVSVAWNCGDPASRPMANGTPPSGTVPGQTAEHMQNTALAFQKHQAAAHAIASVDKLRVVAAEKALGLHGSAIGAGFIMSCTRKSFSSGANRRAADAKQDDKSPKTEWCPYDLVTGRPLPPWAPLRRCIASGLLAAEITQQKSDSTASVNGASPWVSKWASDSPFGGRWARVPSLDLDRYELLPSVVHAVNRTDSASNNMAARQAKPEDVLSQQSALSGGVAHARAQLQRGAMPNQQFSINTAPNADAAALAAVAAGNPMAQMLGNANPQLQQGMPGMPANAMLQGALAGRMPAGGGRVRASPRMSTASSTTDAGSSISKAARKRMSSQTKGRPRKRMATEPRTPTASQLSDLNRTMGMNGMQSVASPAAYARTASAPDAMSTDTRSTMTTATNATGGVDQDTSKTARKTRKRGSKAKHQAMEAAQSTNQAMEAAATAAAAAAAASAAGAIPPTMTGTLPPGVPPTLGQSSPASHAPQTPRSASQSKKQQARGSQRNQVTAAAHAAAAAAAAAGANKQSPVARNQAMLQGTLTPEALAAAGMNKGVDPMSPLGFVGANPAAMNAAGNAMVANARRASVPPGGNAAMMAGGNAANLALNGLLQQGNFGVHGVGDNGMAGINGQTPADMAGMQQMAGANPANAPVGTGVSLATLALQLGITPNQFTGFTPEEAQETYQALARRVAFQNAAGLGPGTVQGTPPTAAPNPNLLANMSAALTGTELNNSAAVAGMGRLGPGSAGLPLGGTVPQAGRGMVSGASAMGSMGLPMTAPRSSAAESQTSARVASGNMAGAGIPNTPDRDSAGAVGIMGGIPTPPGGPGMQAAAGALVSGDRDPQIIWRGDLRLEGQSMDMVEHMVGIQHDLATKPSIRDASGWPRQLDLDSRKLKHNSQVYNWMAAPESQWYIRFVPVDKNGHEKDVPKLRHLVMVMADQKLVFEIKCNEGVGTPGTLYVWGMPLQPQGPSLLGVFRPDDSRPTAVAVDQELQLML